MSFKKNKNNCFGRLNESNNQSLNSFLNSAMNVEFVYLILNGVTALLGQSNEKGNSEISMNQEGEKTIIKFRDTGISNRFKKALNFQG